MSYWILKALKCKIVGAGGLFVFFKGTSSKLLSTNLNPNMILLLLFIRTCYFKVKKNVNRWLNILLAERGVLVQPIRHLTPGIKCSLNPGSWQEAKQPS